MTPFRTPFFLPLLYPSLIWRIPTLEKQLYLTFDDGPVEGPTDFVLETLSKYNAIATFFCIGNNVTKNPRLLKNICDAGHSLGNHTFDHVNGWSTPAVDYLQNVKDCDETMKKLSNKHVTLFRPPYGKITRVQIRRMKNFKIVMWDVLSQDYNVAIKPYVCLKHSINAARKGSIVIFHDSFKAERNLRYALPRFIEHFLERGFSFKPL